MNQNQNKHIQGLPWKTVIGLLTSKYITVTPQLALMWLLLYNGRNRNVYMGIVSKYVRDIKNGRWDPTWEPLVFDDKLRLMDGQHRLWAVAIAGVPARFLVVTGIPATIKVEKTVEKDGKTFVVAETIQVQDLIDMGRRRNLAKLLEDKGYENAKRLSGTLTCILGFLLQCYPTSLSQAVEVINMFRQTSREPGAPLKGLDVSLDVPLPAGIQSCAPLYAALTLLFTFEDYQPAVFRFIAELAEIADVDEPDHGQEISPVRAMVYIIRNKRVRTTGGKRPGLLRVILRAFELFNNGEKVSITNLKEPSKKYDMGLKARLKATPISAAEPMSYIDKLEEIFQQYDRDEFLKKLEATGDLESARHAHIVKASLMAEAATAVLFDEVQPKDAADWIRDEKYTAKERARAMGLCADMHAGRFALTAEPIVINAKTNRVVTGFGRVRLLALTLFGKPLRMMTVLTESISENVNTGKRRSVGNQLVCQTGSQKDKDQAPALQLVGKIVTDSGGFLLSPFQGVMLSSALGFGPIINRLREMADDAIAKELRSGSVIGCLAILCRAYRNKTPDRKYSGMDVAEMLLGDTEFKENDLPLKLRNDLIARRNGKGGKASDLMAQKRVLRDMVAIVENRPSLTVEEAMEILWSKPILVEAKQHLLLQSDVIRQLEEQSKANTPEQDDGEEE